MKTIEEAAKEYGRATGDNPDKPINAGYGGFMAGIEFAQRWIPVEEELPPPEESVLVKDCFGKHRVSVLMYDMKTWKTISMSDGRVTHWRPIELK